MLEASSADVQKDGAHRGLDLLQSVALPRSSPSRIQKIKKDPKWDPFLFGAHRGIQSSSFPGVPPKPLNPSKT